MAETFTADTWLYTVLSDVTLAGYATGGIYAHVNPNTTPTFPFVLFQLQAPGADVRGVGPARVMAQALYLVRGVAQANSFGGTLKSIADRIDVLLQAASGTVSGGVVVSCVREQPFALPETGPGGLQYRHLGGIYRLFVK